MPPAPAATVPSHPPPADVEHFDRLHRESTDPWHVHSRWYEQRKRDLLMAMLPRASYPLAFEPGCSVGGNTLALARRCERLVACDSSRAAILRAGDTVGSAAVPGRVRLECWSFPDRWPDAPCDLLVVAELGYYLDASAFDACWPAVAQRLTLGGDLVLCHWRAPITDAFRTGDEVHRAAQDRLAFTHQASYQEARFRIDVWRKPGGAEDAPADRPTQEVAVAGERR